MAASDWLSVHIDPAALGEIIEGALAGDDIAAKIDAAITWGGRMGPLFEALDGAAAGALGGLISEVASATYLQIMERLNPGAAQVAVSPTDLLASRPELLPPGFTPRDQ